MAESIDLADVVLADEDWRVTVAPAHGLLIREASDARSGAAALWRCTPSAPPPPSRALPPPGPESLDSFWDIFAGGWFPMFPAAGFTGELDEEPTHFHGELNRLPWELLDRGPSWIEARVETVRAPFSVVRRVLLERGELRVETEVENVGAAPASYMYGEHPCLLRETFAGGRLLLGAREAWVPAPSFTPARAVLRPGERFDWPVAPGHGGPLDLSIVPERRDGRRDHACVELAEPTIRVTAPGYGRELTLDVDLAATPYLLLSFGFDEEWDMLAIEPISAPGRSVEDALEAGCIRTLAPGAGFRTAIALRWERTP